MRSSRFARRPICAPPLPRSRSVKPAVLTLSGQLILLGGSLPGQGWFSCGESLRDRLASLAAPSARPLCRCLAPSNPRFSPCPGSSFCSVVLCPARVRTWTNGTKIRCATITLPGKKQAEILLQHLENVKYGESFRPHSLWSVRTESGSAARNKTKINKSAIGTENRTPHLYHNRELTK